MGLGSSPSGWGQALEAQRAPQPLATAHVHQVTPQI
jgi:hypothetical protein